MLIGNADWLFIFIFHSVLITASLGQVLDSHAMALSKTLILNWKSIRTRDKIETDERKKKQNKKELNGSGIDWNAIWKLLNFNSLIKANYL